MAAKQQGGGAWVVVHGITHFKRLHGTGKFHIRAACLNSCHAIHANVMAPPGVTRRPLASTPPTPSSTQPSPIRPPPLCLSNPCADEFKAAPLPTHVGAHRHHIPQQRRAGHGPGA